MSEDVSKTPHTYALSTSWLLCLLAVLPAIFATGFTSYEGLRRHIFAVMIGVALLLWGVDTIRNKKIVLRSARTTSLLIGFGIVCAASIAWSTVPLLALSSASMWVALVGLGWLVLAAPGDRAIGPKHLLTASAVGTGLAAIFGILDKLGVGFLTVVWNSPGATGTFDTMAFGASYYAIALPLALGAMMANRGAARILGAVALLLGGLHFGWCGNWLAFVGTGLAFFFSSTLYIWRSKPSALYKKVLMAGMGLAIVGAVAGGMTQDRSDAFTPEDSASLPLVDALEKTFNEKSKLSLTIRNPRFAYARFEEARTPESRDYLKDVTLALFSEQPAIGHGAGGWWLNQTPALSHVHPFATKSFDRYPAFRSPHNSYAKVLVEFGLVGLIMLAGWILAAMIIGAQGLSVDPGEDEDGIAKANAHSAIVLATWMAALSGLFAMWWGMVLESPEAAALWIMSLALVVRLASDSSVESRGWRAPWTVEKNKGAQSLIAALTIAVGIAVCIPATLDGISDYFRSVGDQFMLRNKYDKARTSYLRAHSIYPAHGEVVLNIASASSRMGNVRDAARSFPEAVALRPNDARMYAVQARLAIQRRELKKAIEVSKKSIWLYPQYIQGYKLLSTAHILSHDYPSAIKVFEKLLSLNPPSIIQGTTHHELAQLYEGPLKNVGKAFKHYELAIAGLKEGFWYDRSIKRYKSIKKRLDRERLMREGKPIPADLMPKSDDHSGHNHGPGKGAHGKGGHGGHDHAIPMDPKLLKFLQQKKLKERLQKGKTPPTPHKHDGKHDHKH